MSSSLHSAVFNPKDFTLANGLRVVVVEQQLGDAVAHMLWYKVGGGDDPIGQSGLAHFLEHLMFKGTETTPAGEFSRFVIKNGGRENAFTSYDYTAYFQIVARPQLKDVMRMEADRMRHLILTPEDIEKERNVILEERNSRIDTNPSALLHEAADAILYDHHPYGTPLIGWKHEIQKLDREEVFAFYRKSYAPQNAILTLSGAITVEEARQLAEFYYGDIPRGETITRNRVQEPPIITQRDVTLRDKRVEQPTLRYYWRLPKEQNDPDRASDETLSIFVNYLGSGASSRLYQQWVVKDKIASAVTLSFNDYARDYDEIILSFVPAPDVSLTHAHAHIRKNFPLMVSETPPVKDIERIRQKILAEAIYAQDSLMMPAYLFGITLTTGGTIDDVEQWPSRMKQVTMDDIMAASHGLLNQEPHVTARLEKPLP